MDVVWIQTESSCCLCYSVLCNEFQTLCPGLFLVLFPYTNWRTYHSCVSVNAIEFFMKFNVKKNMHIESFFRSRRQYLKTFRTLNGLV